MPQDHRSLRSRRALALGLGLTIVGAAAPIRAAAAAAGGPGAPSTGHVVFVTDKRAYLDRGSLDGLEAHQTLQLYRSGRAAGSCTVDTIAVRQATCAGGRARVGDTFKAPGGRRPRPPRPPSELPALIDDATLRTRAVAVAESRYDKVDFSGKPAFRAHTNVLASPSFEVWPDPAGGYSVERIDGAIQGVPLGSTGARFDAAFSAMRWQVPLALARFRPGQPSQFYLWESEISRRGSEGPTVFAVGRLWPWHTPGLTVLDGLQLGRQNEARTVEGGVYAGLIPTALGLAPSTDTWAGGLYGSVVEPGGVHSAFHLAREEARVGVWSAPGVGLVAEGEALGQVWLGPLTVGGGGHARVAAQPGARAVFDRAYVDLGVRPSLAFAAGLHARYLGPVLMPDAPLVGETPPVAGSMHAALDARWDPLGWLALAVFAGADADRDTGRRLAHGAAEIRLPRLFSAAGGLWLGAEAEEGWLRGRAAYAQLVGYVADRVQVLARATASATQFETPTESPNAHELAGYLRVEGTLTPTLRVRAWSSALLPLLVQGEPPAQARPGLIVGSSVTGVF
jgi:hypothetical protein